MSTNVDVVRRLFEAVEQRDIERMLECYAEDVEINEARSLPYGGVYRGHEGVRKHASAFVKTWDRFQTPAEYPLGALFAEGDDGTVTAVFRHRAVDPVTNERYDDFEVGVYSVSGGKVIRSQMFHADSAAVLRFLDGRS
jgi:uncharacterized protein